MPDKGNKDKGAREPRKQAQHSLKEKKALKREKEAKKHDNVAHAAFHPHEPPHRS